MLLFRIDKTDCTVQNLNDPTAEVKKVEVIIRGKRRDRVTKRFTWTDDVDEVKQVLDKALREKSINIQREIAFLQDQLDSIEQTQVTELKKVREAVRQYNDDELFN